MVQFSVSQAITNAPLIFAQIVASNPSRSKSGLFAKLWFRNAFEKMPRSCRASHTYAALALACVGTFRNRPSGTIQPIHRS